jgi:putative ABC transport system ATP-binding protein
MTPIVSDPIVAPPLAAAQTIDAVKVYGRGETTVWGLDGVSVALGSHQFTAIMGPSGSGKSTLMHCVAGLDRLTSGRPHRGHGLEPLGRQSADVVAPGPDRIGEAPT